MMRQKLFDKIYGCLLGVAAGDAMGMPSSLLPADEIQRLFPEGIDSFLPAPPGHMIHDQMVAGEITDDTQQTLLLADLFLETGSFTAEGVARKLIAWADRINAFDGLYLGPSSMRALKLIKDGADISKTGLIGDTNGASMRISPVGLAHPGDLEAVVTDTAEVCKPTHNTNIAIAGAAGVASFIATALACDNLEECVDAYFYGVKAGMQRGGKWTGASIQHRTEWALKLVRSGKTEKDIWSNLYNYIGTGVATSEAVPTSLALVVMYAGDPWQVIRAAANIGGDCDTIGAIAGSMAGAFAGADGFPEHVAPKIEEVNHLGLEQYANRFVEKLVLADD
ncbi:MAG: ADP-ribosylglycohydrolase family protein [Candidatus Marinimicrobia bacterium]|nr:ADP-ribosylglycohydrolase family protein [Candidatus Neomarinimicrobiota bacterium]